MTTLIILGVLLVICLATSAFSAAYMEKTEGATIFSMLGGLIGAIMCGIALIQVSLQIDHIDLNTPEVHNKPAEKDSK